jgi:uncharacterized protein (TIGR00645 family)
MSSSNRAERAFEIVLFSSRWLMAPFYIGLVAALGVLLITFVREIIHAIPHIMEMADYDVILFVLTLIDLSLAANLLLMVIFAGYEDFVSKMDIKGHPDRPDWMGKVDFSGMKLKLVASIVAISAIHLLKAFMSLGTTDKTQLAWLVGIHMAFVTSGVLLALMDYIAGKVKPH